MAKNATGAGRPNKSRGINRKSTSTADWAGADASLLSRAICAAAITGGALRFGYSRDGGAYAVGIYGDGDPYTEFFKPDEDLDQILTDIENLFIEIHDEQMQTRRGAKKPLQDDSDS